MSVSYDVDKDLYKLEFAVDSYAHYMTFEEAYNLAKLMVWKTSCSSSLARAAHAACCLGIENKPIQVDALLSETFTEPSDHNKC